MLRDLGRVRPEECHLLPAERHIHLVYLVLDQHEPFVVQPEAHVSRVEPARCLGNALEAEVPTGERLDPVYVGRGDVGRCV